MQSLPSGTLRILAEESRRGDSAPRITQRSPESDEAPNFTVKYSQGARGASYDSFVFPTGEADDVDHTSGFLSDLPSVDLRHQAMKPATSGPSIRSTTRARF